MKIFSIKNLLTLLLVLMPMVVLIASNLTTPSLVYAATSRIGLGTADNFAVFGAAGVVDTNPPSTITGNVGASPITGAAIGISAAEVTGTIYAVNSAGPSGSINNPGLLTTARNDMTTAYNNATGRTALPDIATDLAGATLTDGVYHAASGTFSITGGGTLTLDGGGNADSVFIFKMGTTLITSSSSKVVLTNGAQACNVYWQVGSSATLGTSTNFIGNILAFTSITDDGSSTVNGRLFAGSTTDDSGAVTLNHTTVTKSTCAAGTAGGPALASSSQSLTTAGGTGGSPIPYCPPLSSQIVAPSIVGSSRISPTSISINWSPYSGVDTFIVQYGFSNGNWLYSTSVTGFSTTINNLPPNQPIWVRVAATNGCTVGAYGPSMFVGGPSLPNAGFAPK